MNIYQVKPRGFCCGVSTAIFQTFSTAKKYKGKEIYLLGSVIHNDYFDNEFKKNNIVLLDDSNKSRYDLLKNNVPDNSVVIFSAHGTPQNVFELAKKKNCTIVDTTCIFVSQTHNLINKYLSENHIIFFIGRHNHPETIAIMNISKNIVLIEDIDDVEHLIKKYPRDSKIFVTNQTTISQYDFFKIIEKLKKYFLNSIYENEICNATKVRQEAIYNLKPKTNSDILLVIGGNKSNNSKKLVEIGNYKGFHSILIDDVDTLENITFNKNSNVFVTAGASTPDELILKINDKLKEINSHKKNS